MLKYLLFIAAILLISCNRTTRRDRFFAPDKKDITAIIEAIINQDSLANDGIPLAAELRKVKVFVPKNNSFLPPPPGISAISTLTLLHISKAHPYNFSKADSLYLLFQNDILKHFTLSTEISGTIQLLDSTQMNSSTLKQFFDISIPLFSSDQKKAYVEVNRYCPSCGNGWAIYLAKENRKWKIIDQYITWQV